MNTLSQDDVTAISEALFSKLKPFIAEEIAKAAPKKLSEERLMDAKAAAEYLERSLSYFKNHLSRDPKFMRMCPTIDYGISEKRRTHPRWQYKDLKKYRESCLV